jgi:hypothetical protein
MNQELRWENQAEGEWRSVEYNEPRYLVNHYPADPVWEFEYYYELIKDSIK